MASTYFVLTFILCCTISCFAAAHSHDHQDRNSLEREKDGAFKPRDFEHFRQELHTSEFDHETIIGSVREAEEYDKLSPEESRRRLSKLLPKIDQDSNGVLTKHELIEWILRNLVKLAEEEAEERMKECDDNMDGIITWKEYLRDSFGVDDEEQVQEDDTGDGDILLQEEKAMWAAADANGDGVLNRQEFQVFINPEEHHTMFHFVVNSTMREKDKNKDGFLDFQEYLGDKDQSNPMVLEAEKERFDDEFDKNHDGKLDIKEVEDWIIPNNVLIAVEEVEHLFDNANENLDSVLSFDEVLKYYHLFVGSEATNYGEMLNKHEEL